MELNIDLICEVKPSNKKGDVTLQWLAGIRNDESKSIGTLKSDWLDKRVKDKKIDFKSDGPENIGEIGVWNWNVQTDQNNADLVHIQSKYNEQIKPIEVLILEQQVNSKEEISKYLRSLDINAAEHGLNVLICFPSSEENQYFGVYCTSTEYHIINSNLKINNDINKLPLYFIDNSDHKKIIRTKQCNFYYLPKIENPTDFIVKSPREILIDLMLEHSQWSSVSVKGLTQKDCNTIEKYLKSFLNKGFFEEFAERSGCSLTEAKAFCRDFVENSDTYLKEKTDEESQFLNDILEKNPSLREKYEKLIDDQWHEESASKIEEKQKELKDLQKKIRKDKREFNKWKKESSEEKEKVQKEIDELTQKKEDEKRASEEAESQRDQIAKDLEGLQNQISEKQKKAEEYKKQIKKQQEEIEKGYVGSVEEIKQPGYIATAQSDTVSLFIDGQPLADDDIDEFTNWYDFSLSLMDNLETAGVENNDKTQDLLKGLAGFLYAAYIDKIPILLAGPNAKNIANAFSSAVYGKLADQFYCEGEFQYTKLKETNESDFVTINNVFHADWIDHIDEITGNLNYCWFTNAFAENLIIEPKGLYNYMIPIVTDLFVAGRPETGYCGKQAKDFEFEETSRRNKNIRQFLKETGSGSLYRKNIELVLKTLTGMPDYSEDWDYYFALLPYAVVTGNENILYEMLESSDQNISKDCFEIIKQYLGENQ